jgi:hypothetical protein
MHGGASTTRLASRTDSNDFLDGREPAAPMN